MLYILLVYHATHFHLLLFWNEIMFYSFQLNFGLRYEITGFMLIKIWFCVE